MSMNYIKFFFTLFMASTLILSCSIKKEKVTILQEQDLESQMIELYNDAYNEFLNGDTIFSAKKFNKS